MLHNPVYRKRRNYQSQIIDRVTEKYVPEDYPQYGSKYRPSAFPAVNIIEYDQDYKIELAAPGFCKEDYNLELDNDVIRISSTKKEVDEDAFTRNPKQEFSYHKFEKSFTLPDNADREDISASCNDGILAVHIPKKMMEKMPKSRIIEVK